MNYLNEIRDSEIQELFEKVSNLNYGKYLKSLEMVEVRGFKKQVVNFDFPVTAIIGPNGGGKTTVLGSAACAYIETKPGRFFPKSGVSDESMQDWKIEHEVIDKQIQPRNTFSRTSKFNNYKWTRKNVLSRDTLLFGVSRTLPASERTELSKFANSKFSVPEENIVKLNNEVCTEVGRILDKDLDGFNIVFKNKSGKVTLLTGKTNDEIEYSEFHFGAGESSVIRMVMEIESIKDNSLVLIEEIENGLHPVATIKLVEYLIKVAKRKKLQVLFTTHSDDALVPLPDKAIWAALNNQVRQGKLNIKSLRALNGQISSQLVIFTEDEFAKKWIESLINFDDSIDYGLIEVHPMLGDGRAVAVNNNHNINPSINTKSICIIDGDSEQVENEKTFVYRLPGEMPETYIFLKVRDVIDEVGGKLSVALHKPFEFKAKLKEAIEYVWRNTTNDRHVLYSKLGMEIGFISEEIVRSAFLSIWAGFYTNETNELLNIIKSNLPSDTV